MFSGVVLVVVLAVNLSELFLFVWCFAQPREELLWRPACLCHQHGTDFGIIVGMVQTDIYLGVFAQSKQT